MPDGSCTAGSPRRSRRVVSGTVGDSILITSAPSSARAVAHTAPAMTMPKEITLIPDSGRGGSVRGRARRSPLAGDRRGIMLAEPGGRATVLREQRLPGHERLARDVELAQGGQRCAHEEAAAARLHVLGELTHGVDQRARDAELLGAGHEVFAAHGRDGRTDDRPELLGALLPHARVGQRGIAELGRVAEQLDQARPVLRRGHRELDQAVPAGPHAPDPGIFGAAPHDLLQVGVPVQLEHVGPQRLVRRDLDELPARGGPCPQRREHGDRDVRARVVIELAARHDDRRPFGRPLGVHDAAQRAGREVGGAPGAVGAGEPERRDRADHGVRGGPGQLA